VLRSVQHTLCLLAFGGLTLCILDVCYLEPGTAPLAWGQQPSPPLASQDNHPSSGLQIQFDPGWSDPNNHLRPHKGLRTDPSSGQTVSSLMWVLHTATGQPLAVCRPGDPQLELYIQQRLTAKLKDLSQRYNLTSLQVEKLKLAAELDVARLNRLAQHLDEQLALADVGAYAPQLNRLLDALALACNQRLFADGSLLIKVLETQIEQP
jgi:hypothetical protein